MRLNREAVADFKRDRKARCFERTIDAIARCMNPQPDDEALFRFVSGMSDRMWKSIATLANETHDCGQDHDAPSVVTQQEVVNLFTARAIRAEKMEDRLAREVEARAERVGRPMKVLP